MSDEYLPDLPPGLLREGFQTTSEVGDPESNEDLQKRADVSLVRTALSDAIVHASGAIRTFEHDAEAMEHVARVTGILFGCWRSLHPQIDPPPSDPPIFHFGGPGEGIEGTIQKLKKDRDDHDEAEEEGGDEEEPNGGRDTD